MKEKITWKKMDKGVRCMAHPTRKHGIRADLYFSIRYQVGGKMTESGLGWASQGWSKQKAISERQRLINEAKQGHGVKTHRQDIIATMEASEKSKLEEQAEAEIRAKESFTVSEYFKEIYYPKIQRQKKKKTYEREETLFRLWINRAIGDKPFKNVERSDIENLFHNVVDNGMAIRTAQYALTTLKQIWRSAKEDGYAPDMPKVAKPIRQRMSKNDNARTRFFSHAEADLLLEAIRIKSIILYEETLISLHCGLRAGEILDLTWSQVDLEYGAFRLKNTKSGKGRSVVMTSEVGAILKAKVKGKPDDRVYPGRHGVRPEAVSKTFKRIADTLFNEGVTDPREKVTFHTCRHTCASWMVMSGVSLYLVQKVLGHSTIQVTERYSHLAPNQLQLAANAIDRSLNEYKEKNVIPFRKKA